MAAGALITRAAAGADESSLDWQAQSANAIRTEEQGSAHARRSYRLLLAQVDGEHVPVAGQAIEIPCRSHAPHRGGADWLSRVNGSFSPLSTTSLTPQPAAPTRYVTSSGYPRTEVTTRIPSSAAGMTGIDAERAGLSQVRPRKRRNVRASAIPAPLEYTRQPPSRGIVPPRMRAYSVARLVAIGERRIGARVVAVRLAQCRRRHDRADADGIGLTERVEEPLRPSDVRQGLRVTQVRMHVHQADLAAEERRALGALENALRAAVIGHRPIEQAHAVRAAKLAPDELEVRARLLRSQHVLQDRVDHRERAVADAGGRVPRMQEIAGRRAPSNTA